MENTITVIYQEWQRQPSVISMWRVLFYWFIIPNINEHKTEPLGHRNNCNTTVFIKLFQLQFAQILRNSFKTNSLLFLPLPRVSSLQLKFKQFPEPIILSYKATKRIFGKISSWNFSQNKSLVYIDCAKLFFLQIIFHN